MVGRLVDLYIRNNNRYDIMIYGNKRDNIVYGVVKNGRGVTCHELTLEECKAYINKDAKKNRIHEQDMRIRRNRENKTPDYDGINDYRMSDIMDSYYESLSCDRY